MWTVSFHQRSRHTFATSCRHYELRFRENQESRHTARADWADWSGAGYETGVSERDADVIAQLWE